MTLGVWVKSRIGDKERNGVFDLGGVRGVLRRVITKDCGSGLQMPVRKRGKERDNMKELEGDVREGNVVMIDRETASGVFYSRKRGGQSSEWTTTGFRSVASCHRGTVMVDVKSTTDDTFSGERCGGAVDSFTNCIIIGPSQHHHFNFGIKRGECPRRVAGGAYLEQLNACVIQAQCSVRRSDQFPFRGARSSSVSRPSNHRSSIT